MSKFIKLTNFRAGDGDLIVKFSDEHNVVVKETSERILKMIETAK